MSKARILVVEDEVIIAIHLEDKLKSLGYEVTSIVNNADDAIKKAEEDKPDLVLMDIRIQGDMDGIETAEIIRNRFDIPVIFSTAYLDEERIERAKITMPFGYVLKPIQERDLKVTLEMALYVAEADAERRKAEDATKAQLAFLDNIMEQSPYAMWISDTTGVVIKTNQMLRKTLNLRDEQIVGKYNVLEDVNLIDEGVMPKVESVFKQKKPAEFTIWWAGNKAGDVDFSGAKSLWISVSIFPVFNHKNEFTHVVCQWLDITERKQTEGLLRKIEWLLEKSVKRDIESTYRPFYGDVTELNTSQRIKGSIDLDVLHSIAGDTIDLLETSVAIYEKNGDYAFGMFSSGWCQLMDAASRKLCGTDDNQIALTCGKWLCHENCWNDSAKVCIESGRPVDIECIGGIHLYAEPIIANQEVVGAINIGYGNPPTDNETLNELSNRFSIPIEELRQAAEAYDTRPPYIIELAKKRLKTSAMLIGKMVESAMLRIQSLQTGTKG